VDCVLQIIEGLEAAQRIGILHRDINSNFSQIGSRLLEVTDLGRGCRHKVLIFQMAIAPHQLAGFVVSIPSFLAVFDNTSPSPPWGPSTSVV
jgi:hypothetical protein